MSFAVEVGRAAQKELARLHGQHQMRIAKAIRGLESNPFPLNVKKL